MIRSLHCAFILFLLSTTVWPADWEVRGRVVDEAGNPVANAMVDRFWRGNGSAKNPDGTPFDMSKKEQVRALWSHLGQMEPVKPSEDATTGTDGSFKLKLFDRAHAIMAMDQKRERGGIVRIPKGKEEQPVEIQLVPLVRVYGRFEVPKTGKKPFWTHIYVYLPEDQTRPLDSFRIADCGSYEARFEVSLPPGEYVLDSYGEATEEEDDIDLRVDPDTKIVVPTGQRELNLGTLQLKEDISLEKRIKQAKANGTWGEYAKHYGEPSPRWYVTEARGVNKDVQISDFKGKWVLLDFWGFGCPYCLSDMPELMKFYEDHKAQRDQFEILSICLANDDSDLQTLADLDRELEPIITHVWSGKTLPFPLMLDPTTKTWLSFGLPSYTKVLIDPKGNLVEGDEKMLAKMLK